ncbi:MAG: 50S ribosomal protein L32 [Minisyncoccia bacterium]
MGGVPGKHTSRSKARRKRSQLSLKKVNLIKCPHCGGPTLPHHACPQCGFYMK